MPQAPASEAYNGALVPEGVQRILFGLFFNSFEHSDYLKQYIAEIAIRKIGKLDSYTRDNILHACVCAELICNNIQNTTYLVSFSSHDRLQFDPTMGADARLADTT